MRRLSIWFVFIFILRGGFYQPAEAYRDAATVQMYLPVVAGWYATGYGQIEGRITNAQDGSPLLGMSVCLQGSSNCMVTGPDGEYTLDNAPAGDNFVEVTPSNSSFSSLSQSIRVIPLRSVTLNFSLSPSLLQGEYRIVLTWLPDPYFLAPNGSAVKNDLDAYLWVPVEPDPYLVYWADTGNCDTFPNACLEHDVRDGNGPETDLILPLNSQGNYHYAVFDYANAIEPTVVPPITQSRARVQIYDYTGLLYSFSVPTSGSGTYWHVFNIDGTTAEIMPVNTISWDPPGPLPGLLTIAPSGLIKLP